MGRPIFLYTDYGTNGFYVGQLHAAILSSQETSAASPAIDLMHDVPAHDIKAAAYLLAALVPYLPEDAVIVGVVDPGVGGERPPVVVECDGRMLVGPGNGMFDIACRRASTSARHLLTWRPDHLSASFHGRDLFAPAAAQIASSMDWRKTLVDSQPSIASPDTSDWPDDLPEAIYIDGFGNVMTGCRASLLPDDGTVAVRGRPLPRATTFSDMHVGEAFWYENSIGLIEIAVNQGRASDLLDLRIGATISLAG